MEIPNTTMRLLKFLAMTFAFVVTAAYLLEADLQEWKKLRLEVVGGEVPPAQTMDGLRAIFADPLVCSGCHQNHFDDWSKSYHAKSIENAGFQALYINYLGYLRTEEAKSALGRDSTAEDLRQCLFCHAPQVQFASDQVVEQISGAIAAGRWDEIRGVQVSCVVCHAITPDGKWSRESFSLAGTKYGPVRGPTPRERSGHQSQYSELHTKSELCATCHSLPPFNVYCSLVYDQYKDTPAARQGQVCQDCHMPATRNVQVAVGGNNNRVLHSHAFAGGRVKEMWPAAIDLNLVAEPRGTNELLATVTMRSKVPHNIPDG